MHTDELIGAETVKEAEGIEAVTFNFNFVLSTEAVLKYPGLISIVGGRGARRFFKGSDCRSSISWVSAGQERSVTVSAVTLLSTPSLSQRCARFRCHSTVRIGV